MSNSIKIDKSLLKQSFARAAESYDAAAVLQREVCDRLIEKFEYINFTPRKILEIGSGTGHATRALQKLFPKAQIVALDIALPMLHVARKKNGFWSRLTRRTAFVNADAEALPFRDNSFDLVFSSLTLQWINEMDLVFQEFRRVLSDNGMLLFSTFGPDTLKELRASWQGVDNYTHVNQFLDMHDIGDAMVRARLAEPVMNTEYLTLTYQDVFGLMRDLKDIGAHNITLQRSRGLTGKDKFQRFQQSYEQFRYDGVLPATYEVVYGHAWSVMNEMNTGRSDSVTIPFDEIHR